MTSHAGHAIVANDERKNIGELTTCQGQGSADLRRGVLGRASCAALTAVCGSVQYPDRPLVHGNAGFLRPTGVRLVGFTQFRERLVPLVSSYKFRLFSDVPALAIDGIGLAHVDERSKGEQLFWVRLPSSGASERRTKLLRTRWYGPLKPIITRWPSGSRRKPLTYVAGRDYIIA
jgi:hypothetical protein